MSPGTKIEKQIPELGTSSTRAPLKRPSSLDRSEVLKMLAEVLKDLSRKQEEQDKKDGYKAPSLPVDPIDLKRVRKEAQELLREIGALRKAGYEIIPEKAITINPRASAVPLTIPGKREFGKSPLDFLRQKHELDKEISPSLAKDRSIGVPVYSLETKKTKGGLITITLFDHFNPTSPVAYHRVIRDGPPHSEEARSYDYNKATAELEKIFNDIFKDGISSRTRTLARMPLRGVSYAVEPMRDKLVSDATKGTIRKIFQPVKETKERPNGIFQSEPELGELTIDYDPRGVDVDRLVGGSLFKSDSKLTLEQNKLHGLVQPILVRGGINSIQFEIPVESSGGKTQSDNMPRTEYTDKNGNLITKFRDMDHEGQEFIMIRISPPPFSFAQHSSRVPVPLRIDLSRLGYGTLNDLFYRTPLPTIGTTGPYTVFSSLPERLNKEAKEDWMKLMGGATAHAEELFGYTPGTKVKRILFVAGHAHQARIRAVDRATVEIHSGLMQKGEARNLVAHHETFHSICSPLNPKAFDKNFYTAWKSFRGSEEVDLSWNFRKGPEAMYKGIPANMRAGAAFLYAINEKNFYGLRNGAGHSQDSPNEFFATLLNSVLHPKWEERVAANQVDFQKKGFGDFYKSYEKALIGLQGLFEKIEVPPNAPIREIVQSRLRFLQRADQSQLP